MAYVPLSQRVLSDIRYEIKAMANKELQSLKPPADPDITVDMIEKKLWGAYYHLKDQMPEVWKTRNVAGISIHGMNHEGRRIYNSYKEVRSIAVDLPPKSPSYVEFTITDVPSLIFWDEYYKQQQEVVDRWNGIAKAIQSYLDGCKSLNDALKHMEELQYYVPQHYLDKVAEKVERKKPEKTAAEEASKVDKDALVAGVIAARLAGS